MSAPPVAIEAIRVRFATFRNASADDRADAAERLRQLPAAERVFIETCHRVELVSVDAEPGDGLHGRAAIRRLFEVVAGFDSAVIAEEQLLGQVRGAYEAALAAGSTGPILNELFRRALRFGRRVRSHARPGTDRSLADPGVAWLVARLPDRSRVAVVGTGEMGRLLAGRLADAGHRLTIVSSSAERGEALLKLLAGDRHRLLIGPLGAQTVAEADALAIAIRPRQPVLRGELFGDATPWTLDLSAPPAVAADARDRLGDRLMSLDRLGAAEGRRPALSTDAHERLRRNLEAEVDAFVAWLQARRGSDALTVLHGEADAVRRRHLQRLRARAGLDERQLAAVEAASAAMVGELLHGPSLELRRGGADAATVRRLFGIER
jgi:glutamyl-tRNA reductase